MANVSNLSSVSSLKRELNNNSRLNKSVSNRKKTRQNSSLSASATKNKNTTKNNNQWSNTNNEAFGTMTKSVRVDNETIIIGMHAHGNILGSEPCIDLNQFKDLQYFQKISMGQPKCLNFLVFQRFKYIFDNLKRILNFQITMNQEFSLLKSARKLFKDSSLPTKSLYRATRSIKYEPVFHLDSDYHHRSYIFYKTPQTNTSNVNNSSILNKQFSYKFSVAQKDIHNFGIYVIFDGKTDTPINSKQIPMLETTLLRDYPYRYFKTKSGIYTAKTTTSELIQFFLSKGYKNILIHDITCGNYDFGNKTPCSRYY